MPDIFDLIKTDQRMDQIQAGQKKEFERFRQQGIHDVFDAVTQPKNDKIADLPADFTVDQAPERQLVDAAKQMGKESIAPTAGAVLGARFGGLPGAALGGIAGEGLNQLLGVTEVSPEQMLMTGAADLAAPVIGRGLVRAPGLLKRGVTRVAEKMPGASAAIKQPSITRMRSLPGKFAPARAAADVYEELAQQGDFLIRPRESRASLLKLAKEQTGKDPSLKDSSILRDMKAIDQTYPIHGKPFSEMQRVVRDLNEKIGVAKAKGGEKLHNLTTRRNAVLADMESAEVQFPLLKEANRTFKQQTSSQEFKAMVENSLKTLESAPAGIGGKRSVIDMDAKSILDKLRIITNPRNPEKYDKLFTEGIGKKNLDEAIQALEKINDFGPVRIGWTGGGGLVAQGAVAGLGAGVAGAMLGGPIGGLVGGLAGAAAPTVIAEALLRRPARAFLLKSLKAGKGKINNPDQFFAALGSILAHSSPEQE